MFGIKEAIFDLNIGYATPNEVHQSNQLIKTERPDPYGHALSKL
jgi:hypothetical protein